jgi:CubicO group peptidase (beta-lactamase class C family)
MASLILAAVVRPVSAEVFPSAAWESRPPGDLGLDAGKLQQLATLVAGSGIVIRDGYQAFAWGNPANTLDWASASKPVISTLLFMAEDEGLCSSDDAVGDYLAGGSSKDAAITFFQLANMTSGYSRGEAGGVAWAYNDVAINLYGYLVTEKVFGATPSTVFDDKLGFLDFQDAVTVSDGQFLRLKVMSVRDFARLGLFWLKQGRWDDTQVIPASYFDRVTNHVSPGIPVTNNDGPESWSLGSFGGSDNQGPTGPGHYGMNFWVNTNGFYGGAEASLYAAVGHGGQKVCFVFPDRNLVVVGHGTWGHPSTAAVQLIVEADTRTSVEPETWAGIKSKFR